MIELHANARKEMSRARKAGAPDLGCKPAAAVSMLLVPVGPRPPNPVPVAPVVVSVPVPVPPMPPVLVPAPGVKVPPVPPVVPPIPVPAPVGVVDVPAALRNEYRKKKLLPILIH